MPGLSTWPTMGGAGWPTAGGAVGSDAVQIRHPLRGQDASGGRTITYGEWLPDVLGAVVKAVTVKSITMLEFAREGELIKYTVTLDIRLGYRDQILWLETGDIFTVVRALASGTQAARTWDHLCEELTQ